MEVFLCLCKQSEALLNSEVCFAYDLQQLCSVVGKNICYLIA